MGQYEAISTRGPLSPSIQSNHTWTVESIYNLMRKPMRMFAIFKHIVSAAYFIIWISSYLVLGPTQLKASGVYAPMSSVITSSCIAYLHLYDTFSSCRRRETRVLPFSTVSTRLSSMKRNVFNIKRIQLALRKISDAPDLITGAFLTAVESACQTYQAFLVSKYISTPSLVMFYVILVIAHCLCVPWLMFARHSIIHTTAVNFINSVFSFCLSTGFYVFMLLPSVIHFIFLDPNLKNEPVYLTRIVLTNRLLLVTSPISFVTKFLLFIMSYLSLRRLEVSLRKPIPATCGHGRIANLFNFKNQFQLKIYLVINFIWGGVLLYLLLHSTIMRKTCPSWCIAQVYPLGDTECQCACVHLHCERLGITGTSVDEYIHPEVLGTSLLYLHISQCDMPHGILDMDMLELYTGLHGIHIFDTKLTTWTGKLPSSLHLIYLRNTLLETIPDVLRYDVPDGLIFLVLEGGPALHSIEDNLPWQNIHHLTLMRLQLTHAPSFLTSINSLTQLTLSGNNISALTVSWQQELRASAPLLNRIDLSDNHLTHIPEYLASPSIILELSSNPIEAVISHLMPLIEERNIILDMSPACDDAHVKPFCHSKCSPTCLSSLVGNKQCDFFCFIPGCQWDMEDCDRYGLSKSKPILHPSS